MKKEIVLLDLFSGIGGFAKGLTDSGFVIKKHYFSEIDKHAIANYQYNFKHAKYVGSIESVRGANLDKIDIITFGWPCQDNSIAGKRKGQRDGTRSGLLTQAVRLINETKPQIFIAENVKGLLSVNEGYDFYETVKILSDLDSGCPQYSVEMQLLNTAWLLPQNRERTYFVGHLGTCGCRRIFPLSSSDIRTIEGKSETAIVRAITAGGASGGHHSGMTLIKSNNKKGFEEVNVGDSIDFNVSHSSTRRGIVGKGIAHTIDTQVNQGVYVDKSSSLLYWAGSKDKWVHDDRNIVPALSRQSDHIRNTLVIKNLNFKENFGNTTRQRDRVYDPDGIMACLSSSRLDDKAKICVAQRNENREKGGKQCLEFGDETKTNCLTSVQKDNMILEGKTIRRLTEIECERLQGFPDNWTKFGIYNGVVREIAKTHRYKMCGNAVTVKVVEVVGRKLVEL